MKIPYKLNPFGKSESGADITKGLVIYVPFKSDLIDKINNVIFSNKYGTISFSENQDGLPAIYDSDGTIYYNNYENYDVPKNSDPFTLSIWIEPDVTNIQNSFWMLTYGQRQAPDNLFGLNQTSGTPNSIQFGPYRTAGQAGKIYPLPSNDALRGWHHFCVTHDPISLKACLYVDGQLKKERTIDNGFSVGTKPYICLGGQTETIGPYHPGWRSSLRVYNRVLNEEEVKLLFQEFTPTYKITASDQTLSGFNPAQAHTESITYTCSIPISFEIISGDTLPNTITFNTSTGKFSGKALSDTDHTYNLVVRMSGQDVVTKDINVTIKTSATSTLTVPSPQTFNFITEASDTKNIQMTEIEYPSFTISSGTLPSGVSIYRQGVGLKISSTGTQISNETQQVQIAVTTTYHPEPVYATLNINVALNQITVPDKSFKFYIDDGSASKSVAYTTQNTITPVYSLSGTLPNGITFDSSTGTFTYDGVYDTPTSGEVNVIVNSSTGCSTQGMGKYTFELKSGSMPLPDDYSFYAPLQSLNETQAATGQQILDKNNMTGLLTAQTFKGVPCIYSSASSFAKRWWKYDQTGIAKGNEARTLSMWAYFTNQNAKLLFAYGQTGSSPNYGVWLRLATDSIDLAHFSFSFSNFTAQLNTWYHFVVTIDTTRHVSLYINGTLIQTGTTISFLSTSQTGGLYVFGNNWQDGWNAGYFSSLRIYNRVLTQEEITKLSQEFTPTE